MEPEKLLKNYSDEEKGAYLGAIASIAMADQSATDDEIEFLRVLAEGASLSAQQEEAVVRAASEISGEELTRCLNILQNSDLRFSLIADIISFANADGKYSPDEKVNVEKIAQYLQVNTQQFSLLDQFVTKSNDSKIAGDEVTKPGFLESLGLNDKLEKAGINTKSLTTGLLGVLAPLLVTGLITGGMNRRRGGGLNSRFANPSRMGGIGSLISLLSGRRGYGGMGNISSRLFGSQNQTRGIF